MKILILTNILTPYRIDFFRKMNSKLTESGGEFHVLVMSYSEPGRDWTYDKYKENFTILLQNKSLSLKGIHIHLNRNLKDVLVQLSPDIVICAGGYLLPSVWKTLFYRKKIEYKVLFWSETHLNEERNYSSSTKFIRERIRHYIYKKFDGFLYAGEMSKKFILRYMKNDAKLFFLPNTVDNDTYESGYKNYKEKKSLLRREYGLDEDKYIFITPARLIPEKGIDRFLEICKDSKEKSKAIFLVAGDGEQREKLIGLSRLHDIDLRLLGYKEQDEIIKLYALADCFLLPSISDANPLTVIEALWSGLPLLLSSNIGNYPETLKIGENGYVFNYLQREETIKIVENIILSDKHWSTNASEMSLKIARLIYDSKKVITNLINDLLVEFEE